MVSWVGLEGSSHIFSGRIGWPRTHARRARAQLTKELGKLVKGCRPINHTKRRRCIPLSKRSSTSRAMGQCASSHAPVHSAEFLAVEDIARKRRVSRSRRALPVHEFSPADIRDVFRAFHLLDLDGDGLIDRSAMLTLDIFRGGAAGPRDAKLGLRQFFAVIAKCPAQEADDAFAKHGFRFDAQHQPLQREWSAQQIRDAMEEFRRASNGTACASRLPVPASRRWRWRTQTTKVDSKIGPQDFFAWYVCCTAEEAAQAFQQHGREVAAVLEDSHDPTK